MKIALSGERYATFSTDATMICRGSERQFNDICVLQVNLDVQCLKALHCFLLFLLHDALCGSQ